MAIEDDTETSVRKDTVDSESLRDLSARAQALLQDMSIGRADRTPDISEREEPQPKEPRDERLFKPSPDTPKEQNQEPSQDRLQVTEKSVGKDDESCESSLIESSVGSLGISEVTQEISEQRKGEEPSQEWHRQSRPEPQEETGSVHVEKDDEVLEEADESLIETTSIGSVGIPEVTSKIVKDGKVPEEIGSVHVGKGSEVVEADESLIETTSMGSVGISEVAPEIMEEKEVEEPAQEAQRHPDSKEEKEPDAVHFIEKYEKAVEEADESLIETSVGSLGISEKNPDEEWREMDSTQEPPEASEKVQGPLIEVPESYQTFSDSERPDESQISEIVAEDENVEQPLAKSRSATTFPDGATIPKTENVKEKHIVEKFGTVEADDSSSSAASSRTIDGWISQIKARTTRRRSRSRSKSRSRSRSRYDMCCICVKCMNT
eukprot:92893-Amorphochlora_amoeboformis.AAC.1